MSTSSRVSVLLTNDVESHSIWHNKLRYETGVKVAAEGIPRLLDLYDRYEVSSTFYVTGYMGKHFPDMVRSIADRGHEVGSHGLSHEVHHGFDVMPFADQLNHLSASRKILQDASGQAVQAFRAPALRVNTDTARALAEAGYTSDSSVASQRFDFFLSFGSVNKLKWLSAPRKVYRTHPDDLLSRGTGPIVEVPLTALGLPFVGTTMRILPTLTTVQQRFFQLESRLTGKPIVFDVHPNEFIEEQDGTERQIARRARNPVAYLLKDVVRGTLKVRNLGLSGLEVYRRFVAYHQKSGVNFQTVSRYVEDQDL